MSATSLGPHVGHVYVPGLGRGEAFSVPEKPKFLSVMVNRTGHRYFVPRERITFTK